MLEFRDLPLIVNELIIRYLFNKDLPISMNLFLLGVCHDWRQIALPLVYDSFYISECDSYTRRPVQTWKHLTPSGRIWDINILPFNASDMARFAKRIRIDIVYLDSFEEAVSSLRNFVSLHFDAWRHIPELVLSTTKGVFNQDNNSDTLLRFKSLSNYLLKTFPTIIKLKLNNTGGRDFSNTFFAYFISSLSANLRSLSISFPMEFRDHISLKNVTELNLKLVKGCCKLLSFVDSRILRKLSLTGVSNIYFWKHFRWSKKSMQQLVFPKLNELYIGANKFIEVGDRLSSHLVRIAISEHTFISKHKRLSEKWENDISKRRVSLPCLEIMRVNGGHFGDLLFKNCSFPRQIDRLHLRDFVDLIGYNSWILDRISADYVEIRIDSSPPKGFTEGSKRIVGAEFGARIVNLCIILIFDIDPAVVDLRNLQILYVGKIAYPTLTELIRKLPSLHRLTVEYMPNSVYSEDATPSLGQIYANPFSSSILSLEIMLVDSPSTNGALIDFECLLVGLPNLRIAMLGSGFIEALKTFMDENQDRYPHFKNIYIINGRISAESKPSFR